MMLIAISAASRFRDGVHTVIAQLPLIEYPRCALMSHVRNPDTTNSDTLRLQSLVQFVPQRLVQFLYTRSTKRSSHLINSVSTNLREPIGMAPNDRNLTLSSKILLGRILLDS